MKDIFDFIKYYIENTRGETLVVAFFVTFITALILAAIFFGIAGVGLVFLATMCLIVGTLLLMGIMHVYSSISTSIRGFKEKKENDAERIVDRLRRGY